MMFSICSSPYLIFSSHLGLEFVNGLFEIMPPLSHPPCFSPFPALVSWRIKLMIVPVLNYSWFNKIDAYLFRFVASLNILSLLNWHFLLCILRLWVLLLVFVGFLEVCVKRCQQPQDSVPSYREKFSRGTTPLQLSPIANVCTHNPPRSAQDRTVGYPCGMSLQ